MPTNTPITIRTLHTPEEMDAAVDLQKVYWGDDMGSLVPSHMLLSIAKYGGHIHGAYDDLQMVGMLHGFLGARIQPDDDLSAPKRLLVMSKRMVVLPEYRGHKIGERLKLAQRDFAIRHGIELVTWTFDPLLARNAYLNLHKLGAVGQQYEEDYFGSNATNPALSADRLVVNWWVQHPHVQARQEKAINPVAESLLRGAVQCINETVTNAGGLPVPLDTLQTPSNPVVLLEIPIEFVPVERLDAGLGRLWRDHVRAAFHLLLNAGYIAVDVIRSKQLPAQASPLADDLDRVFYVFKRDDGTFDFSE